MTYMDINVSIVSEINKLFNLHFVFSKITGKVQTCLYQSLWTERTYSILFMVLCMQKWSVTGNLTSNVTDNLTDSPWRYRI